MHQLSASNVVSPVGVRISNRERILSPFFHLVWLVHRTGTSFAGTTGAGDLQYSSVTSSQALLEKTMVMAAESNPFRPSG